MSIWICRTCKSVASVLNDRCLMCGHIRDSEPSQPAPSAQGEKMTNGPWIDGSVTLPKVGDFIKWVHFYRDRDGQVVATVPGVALVVNPNDWVGYHYRVIVSKIVVDTIPYVPPVAPLPELEEYAGYRADEVCHPVSGWWRIDIGHDYLVVRHECRATCRRMFNAAVKAMKGE